MVKAFSPSEMRLHADHNEDADDEVDAPKVSRSALIKAGQDRARNAGKLGGHRNGSHELTAEDRRRGGKRTAQKRKRTARERYGDDLMRKVLWWRRLGYSFRRIAQRLDAMGITAPKGGKPTAKMVERMVKRDEAAERDRAGWACG